MIICLTNYCFPGMRTSWIIFMIWIIWEDIVDKSDKSRIISIKQMEGNEELWQDWINCDNEYAAGDKKAIDAGACKYLNFIAIVLQRKE